MCRFKIRECIRRNILKESSDYFDVKREKSTFNSNFKESGEEEHHNEDIDGNETDHETESPTENYPIIRIGRLFHIENHLQAQLRRFINGLFSNFIDFPAHFKNCFCFLFRIKSVETQATNDSENANENHEENNESTERVHQEQDEEQNSVLQTIFQINNIETNRQVNETTYEQTDQSHSESFSDEDIIQLDRDESDKGKQKCFLHLMWLFVYF